MTAANLRTRRFFPRAYWISMVIFLLSAILASSPVGRSFKIAPLKNVHETMTLMASDCIRGASSEARLASCSQSPAAVMDKDVIKNKDLHLEGLGLGRVFAKELTNAVRWPDDPTHEVAAPTLIKFGLKMRKGCKNVHSGVRGELLANRTMARCNFGMRWHRQKRSNA